MEEVTAVTYDTRSSAVGNKSQFIIPALQNNKPQGSSEGYYLCNVLRVECLESTST